MFRTPTKSIRVPDLDDGDIPGAVRDMMTDIEYLTDRYLARLLESQRRCACGVSGSVGTVLPNGAQTTLSWSTETYDSDSMFDVAAPTILTVPAGVWLVTLNGIMVGAGVLQDAHIRIVGSVAGEVCGSTSPSSQTSTNLSTNGLINTNGETFIAQAYQRSGGNGSFIGRFTAMRVANL
jgi:hypothetical protein